MALEHRNLADIIFRHELIRHAHRFGGANRQWVRRHHVDDFQANVFFPTRYGSHLSRPPKSISGALSMPRIKQKICTDIHRLRILEECLFSTLANRTGDFRKVEKKKTGSKSICPAN